MIVTLLQSKITKQVAVVQSVAQVKLLVLVMMKMVYDKLTQKQAICSDISRSVRSDLNHLLQFKKSILSLRVHSMLDQTENTDVINSIDNTC